MDQRNLILAIVLSLAILITFEVFYVGPERSQIRERAQQAETTATPPEATDVPVPVPGATGQTGQSPGSGAIPPAVSRDEALADSGERLPIVTGDKGTLRGSVALTSGRFDDLVLQQYRETIAPGSPDIELLRPVGGSQPYFVNFGWTPLSDGAAVPNGDSQWQTNAKSLKPGQPVTLTWDSGQGLRFERVVSLDDEYMLTVTQRVVNDGSREVSLSPYGLISRTGTPDILGFYILHEGPIGVFDDALEEIDYSDLVGEIPDEYKTTGGWLGITDKYWLVALVPDQTRPITSRFLHEGASGEDKYQADYIYGAVTIPAGASAEVTSRLFAGAKQAQLLDDYREEYGIPLFDRAIDFGWFWFLTKPFFYALHYFAGVLGNYGLSILLLTVLIKIAFFPLANKSYRAMAKMRKLQPEMARLKERFGDDKQRLNQEMMALYKKEGANPMSGCLPVVIQIPVFFALYKVLFVSIEMRQAPFFGWIQDLSAPDPTSILNGFGLLPWGVPELGTLDLINLGIWPIVMGLSMVFQHRLNPQPTDPVQAKIFAFMPIIFTFLLAKFPAGLVIYWTWNNVLSILQQVVIMKRMGVPIGRPPKS